MLGILKSLFRRSKKMQIPHEPWLDTEAIIWLNDLKLTTVFEWGSGGSTFFFADRALEVVSIENDEQWFHELRDELRKHSITNVTLNYLPHDGEGSDCMDIQACTSKSLHFNNKKFENYVKSIDSYPDNYFDLVLVDGRARISCVAHAMPKVKAGGYLVLDDTHREYYLPAISSLQTWSNIEFKGDHKTRAWIKPKTQI